MLTRGWRICWITALSEILRCGRAEDSCWLMLTPVQSDHCYAGHWPVTSCFKEDCWGESNDRSQLDQLVKLLSSDFNLHPTPRDQHNHLPFCQWLTNLGLFGASERMGWFFHLAAAAAAGELPHRRHSCSTTPLQSDRSVRFDQSTIARRWFQGFWTFCFSRRLCEFCLSKKTFGQPGCLRNQPVSCSSTKNSALISFWFFNLSNLLSLGVVCKFEFANK